MLVQISQVFVVLDDFFKFTIENNSVYSFILQVSLQLINVYVMSTLFDFASQMNSVSRTSYRNAGEGKIISVT